MELSVNLPKIATYSKYPVHSLIKKNAHFEETLLPVSAN